MTFDYVLGAAVTIALIGYLLVVMLRPERF